jgi:hypothetical protein
MKHTLLSLFLLTFATAAWTQVPNGSFDNTTTQSSCEQPEGWNTVNGSTGAFGLCTAETESGNAYSGNALKITSQFFLFAAQVIPGLVSNGNIDIQNQSVTGGVPFTERPTSFSGWYRAEPENGDTYSMIAVLINENTGDSVGVSIFEGTETVTDWTQFLQPVQYLNQQTPTLLQITMFASEPTSPQNGSTVWFDELDYQSITVGISENQKDLITAYPNPVTDNVNFELGNIDQVLVNVYNIIGVRVMEANLSGLDNRLNLSLLPEGTYIWQMTSLEGELIKAGKLQVAR